jgi:exodeoxyribonuclease VII large subunit
VRANDNRLRHLARDVADASMDQVTRRQTQLRAVAGRLHALSPLATLARGYAVARDASGATLSSTAAFHDDMPFELIVRDGVVPAQVRRDSEEKP